MVKIVIILSTFNGEKFLNEQLSSLKNQTLPFQLFVRDDGSKDKTIAILEEWKSNIPMKIILGKNIGPMKSFGELLKLVPKNIEYVFFCDQDDIWEPEKIAKSLELMQTQEFKFGNHVPMLFHSDLSVIDEDSKIISNSFWKFQRIESKLGIKLNRLLMQNTVTGCSSMLNSALVCLIKEIPKEAKMHDWWIALIACSLGKIIVCDEPLVRYRMHENNVIGGEEMSFLKIRKTLFGFFDYIQKWKSENKSRFFQAEAFYKLYRNNLPVEKKELLEKFLQIHKYIFLKKKIFSAQISIYTT